MTTSIPFEHYIKYVAPKVWSSVSFFTHGAYARRVEITHNGIHGAWHIFSHCYSHCRPAWWRDWWNSSCTTSYAAEAEEARSPGRCGRSRLAAWCCWKTPWFLQGQQWAGQRALKMASHSPGTGQCRCVGGTSLAVVEQIIFHVVEFTRQNWLNKNLKHEIDAQWT